MAVEAKFHWVCATCGDRILPGEMIESEEGDIFWSHVTCPDDDFDEDIEVCDKCFMQKSVSGECSCW